MESLYFESLPEIDVVRRHAKIFVATPARNRTRDLLLGNGSAEREELVDVFRKEMSELLALTETKLKGNREVTWWG